MFPTPASSLPLSEFIGGTGLASPGRAGADGGSIPLPIGLVAPGDGLGGSVVPRHPAPPPGGPTSPAPGQGGFFDVLESLLNQLDGILGSLLGASSTSEPGGTTETPALPRPGI